MKVLRNLILVLAYLGVIVGLAFMADEVFEIPRPINISAVTDQNSYTMEEGITLTYTAENTSSKTLKQVTISMEVPQGLTLSTETPDTSVTVTELSPGQSEELTVILYAGKGFVDYIGNDDVVLEQEKNRTWLKVAALVLLTVGMLIILIRYIRAQKGKRAIAIFLILVLLAGTAVPFGYQYASAKLAEDSVSCKVTTYMDGRRVDLTGTAIYTME